MKYRLNKKRFAGFVLSVIFIASITALSVDFFRFPESYLPTWKYQLQNGIKRGDAEMIKYYQETYISTGRELFD